MTKYIPAVLLCLALAIQALACLGLAVTMTVLTYDRWSAPAGHMPGAAERMTWVILGMGCVAADVVMLLAMVGQVVAHAKAKHEAERL